MWGFGGRQRLHAALLLLINVLLKGTVWCGFTLQWD
jgi:hypothetical protein